MPTDRDRDVDATVAGTPGVPSVRLAAEVAAGETRGVVTEKPGP